MRVVVSLVVAVIPFAMAEAAEPRPADHNASGAAPAATQATAKGFTLKGETWTYRDTSLSMDGILVRPTGTGPFPAILISHGMGGSAVGFSLQKARVLAQKGFVCIGPNYTHSLETLRGDDGRLGPGARAGAGAGGEKGPGASAENLRRAEKCLEILDSLPYVDHQRLYAYGHSMGGFVTIALAAKLPGRLSAAAVSGSGVVPRVGFAAPSAEEAGMIRTPFCLIHGELDHTVPPERSAMLKAVLDRNGIACERTVFPGVDHAVDQRKPAEVIEIVRAWFDRFSRRAIAQGVTSTP